MLMICTDYDQLNIPELLQLYSGSVRERMEQEEVSRFQAEREFCDGIKLDFFSSPAAFYAFWMIGDQYASGLRMEPYENGYLLCGLETQPALRGLGYATKLVCHVLQYMSGRGTAPVYAHVHKQNKISVAVHETCGFSKMKDYGALLDGTVSRHYYTFCYIP